MLQGKEIEEEWLEAEDEEVFEQMDSGMEEPAEGSYRDILRKTALRWTTAQTSFEIYAGDDGYLCQALAPLGRNDSQKMETVMEEVDRILSLLDNGDENIKVGELLNE